MEHKLNLNNIFKSSVKGTFVSATSTTFLGALLATSLYVNESYSNPISILRGYYLSLDGLVLGIVVPFYVGLVTAGLVLVFTRVSKRFNSNNSFRNLAFLLLVIAYIPITFIGAMAILYLGN
jgi:hypothetical protein